MRSLPVVVGVGLLLSFFLLSHGIAVGGSDRYVGTYIISKIIYQLEVNQENLEITPTTIILMEDGSYFTHIGVWELTRDIIAADFVVDLYMTEEGKIEVRAQNQNLSDKLGEQENDL